MYPTGYKYTVFNYPVFNPNALPCAHLVRSDYSKSLNPVTRSDSLKRSKEKIYDIAILNQWSMFVTLTIDPNKIDSFDSLSVKTAFLNWIHNMQKRHNMVYLFVAELHKSGRIHFHGLVNGNFDLISSGHLDNKGRVIYNLENWKYGFSTAIYLDDNKEAVARYITKYITKELQKILPKMYYAGGAGLIREPEKIYLNLDYNTFQGKEFVLPFNDFAKVKYRFDRLDNED